MTTLIQRSTGQLLILAAALLFSSKSFSSTQAPLQWVAIEKTVADALKDNWVKPFDLIGPRFERGHLVAQMKEADLSKLSLFVHQHFKRCGGFRVLESPLDLSKSMLNKNNLAVSSALFADYQVDQSELVKKWFTEISPMHMEEIILHLTSYKTRYYKAPEGVAAMKWIASKWQELTARRSDVSVELFDHGKYPQPSVILTFRGKKASADDLGPIIILGGHGDSINTNDEGIHSHAPGADDNAAGIALLTEIIRLMALHNYAPNHTIQFIAYAAEEVGIQGSYHLARTYREQRRDVLGVIQFDGVNFKGPSYDMSLVGDNTHPEQNKFVAALIDTYLQANWRYEFCHYACSDHAAWNYEGYRASYPVEGIASEQNPYFHTEHDTYDKSGNNVEHATLFTKLGIAYLLELDN